MIKPDHHRLGFRWFTGRWVTLWIDLGAKIPPFSYVHLPPGELPKVDHLVFMVHGIGPVCDLRFRSMIECGEYRTFSFSVIYESNRMILIFLGFQWMTSVACLWSCCTVTLRNRWTSTPSAEWSSCLSGGTRLYTEMQQGWTGEGRQDGQLDKTFRHRYFVLSELSWKSVRLFVSLY